MFHFISVYAHLSRITFSETPAWQAVENAGEVIEQVLKIQAKLGATISKLEKMQDSNTQETLGYSADFSSFLRCVLLFLGRLGP